MYFWQHFKSLTIVSLFALGVLLVLVSDTAAQSDTLIRLPLDRPVYRIETTQDGVYEITHADLVQAGMDMVAADPNTFEMMYRGQSVAYQFVGNDDDEFTNDESIRFYSWVLDGPRREKRYVDRQTFWLWAGGNSQRVATVTNADANYPAATAFPEQLIFEGDDDVFWTTNLNEWGDFDPDEWYWDRLGSFFFDGVQEFDTNGDGITDQSSRFEAARYEVEIPNPAPTMDEVQFAAEFLTSDTGSYSVTVSLGDGEGYREWLSHSYVQITGTTTSNRLWDGTNTFQVSGSATDTNGNIPAWNFADSYPDNRVWFNKLIVNYMRSLQAIDDQLIIDWDTAGQHELHVRDMSESNADNAIVWNISDRLMPAAINMTSSDITAVAGSNQWRIAIEDGTEQLLVTTEANILTPEAFEAYEGTDISPENGARWVAITHPDFLDSTNEVAAYRAESGNMSTHVVDITDIIYQYGYGFNMPEAIRAYMQEAYNTWETRPDYLLLVGDATWTLFNKHCRTCTYNSETQKNYIVTNLSFYDPVTAYSPNDHYYAMLDGDDIIPDIAVGRIPANTPEDVDNVLNKIKLYEAAIRSNAPWVNDILYLADDKDNAGDFCKSSNDLQTLMTAESPGSYSYTTYCMDDILAYPDVGGSAVAAKTTMRTLLFDSINENGHGLVNYRGHGAVPDWAGGLVKVNEHETEWQNSDKPTVIISADCLDTDFARIVLDGLGETFLKLSDGGTAAHWGATGLGFDGDHTILQNGFYTGLLQGDFVSTIGDAAVYAKRYYIQKKSSQDDTQWDLWSEIWEFTLLGDPAMLMPTPGALYDAAVAEETAVTLTDNSLTATRVGDTAQVSWEATAGSAIETYLVQRATASDGFADYQSAAFTAFVGQIDATTEDTYTVTDTAALETETTYYYRLIAVDDTGQRHLVEDATASITFQASDMTIHVMLPILRR